MLQNKFGIILFICLLAVCYGKLSFTNLNCTSIDKNFTDIEYCFIKAVNRTYQYMSVKVKLHQVVKDFTLRLKSMKCANGYKPFLYDVTLNGCTLLRKRNNPIGNLFFKLIAGVTNLNHSCPFNHDIIVKNVSNIRLHDLFTNYLPMPRGDYALYTTWSVFNVPQVYVNIYVKLE